MKGRGFTLPEVIIAAAVGLAAGTFLVSILINNNFFSNKQNAYINEGLGLNQSMTEIDALVRRAAAVASGYPEGSPTYTSDSDTLVLKIPTLGSGGLIDNTYDYAVIAADLTYPQNLRLQVFPDPAGTALPEDKILMKILESLVIEYLDENGGPVTPTSAAVVKVTLEASFKQGFDTTSRTVSSTVSLRNR